MAGDEIETDQTSPNAEPGDVLEVGAGGATSWLPVPGEEDTRTVRLQAGHCYTVVEHMELPVNLLGKTIRADAAALLIESGHAEITPPE